MKGVVRHRGGRDSKPYSGLSRLDGMQSNTPRFLLQIAVVREKDRREYRGDLSVGEPGNSETVVAECSPDS